MAVNDGLGSVRNLGLRLPIALRLRFRSRLRFLFRLVFVGGFRVRDADEGYRRELLNWSWRGGMGQRGELLFQVFGGDLVEGAGGNLRC
jgi:hypothetical protein